MKFKNLFQLIYFINILIKVLLNIAMTIIVLRDIQFTVSIVRHIAAENVITNIVVITQTTK